jgi:hypothetical protein
LKTLFILILNLATISLFASINPDKNLKAFRINQEIKIDGVLSESEWSRAERAFGFVQTEPTPGLPATFDTDTYFLYDNNAIYIGAKMKDPEPEKILKELSLRDQTGNADNFSVFFDPYKSGLNGFLFLVTASGVQYEAIVTNNDDDSNWNAVWESAVSQDNEGWYVEIKIPYSSLRFPSIINQDWHVQFGREVRRFRETSYWSPIDPTIAGWVQQSGKVTNIENIKSPVRLSLTPYLSGYLNTTYDPNNTGNKLSSGNAYSAGLDLKYGLNDAFTLDMTLIPDFGQVISDRQVLNLSPFEVFFEENRQFFTEGVELFNRGNIFYSRRIGGRPLHYFEVFDQVNEGETILSNPETSQLFNATKISGRTTSGTGIGAFNAFVGEEHAIIRAKDSSERKIKTNPLTNYNALVIDQNLKNNSFVSLMNTNVYRLGEDYDANVTGGYFDFKTKDQKYFISGSGVLSQKYFNDFTERGHTYNINLGKISGNWTYGGGHGVESDKYDPNDMGFLLSPNEQFYYVEGGYTQYKPKNEKLQQIRINGSSVYSRLYNPNVFTDFNIELESFVLWKSRFALGLNTRLEPVDTYDYFEPRTKDFSRFMTWPTNYTIGGFVSSDYRKPFAYDVRLSYRHFNADQRQNTNIVIAPRFRISDKWSVFTNTALSIIDFEPGYVNKALSTQPILELGESDLLFGNRNRLIVENSITTRFIFNAIMGINMRIRHYWDKVRYQQFGKLDDNGIVDVFDYDGLDVKGDPIFDRNVNIFNIDLHYNWRFAPGSDVIFVWKNQIFNSDKQYERDYLANLGGLFESTQTNSFSVRVLYFLDYLYVFPRKIS